MDFISNDFANTLEALSTLLVPQEVSNVIKKGSRLKVPG